MFLASLGVAAGVAFSSALVPLINTEIFLIALVTQESGVRLLHCFALGAVVAVAQVAGKLFYFLAARGSLHLPAFMHRKEKKEKPMTARRQRWHQRTKRIRGWLAWLTEKCKQHPVWMTSTYGVSAVVGLPPFMATTVLAGLVRMSTTMFVTTGVLGRFVRFTVLAASPSLFVGWAN